MQTNSQQPYAAISPIKAEVLKENQFRTNDMPAGSALLVGNVAMSNVAGSFCTNRDASMALDKGTTADLDSLLRTGAEIM